jgi:hypothetical protein
MPVRTVSVKFVRLRTHEAPRSTSSEALRACPATRNYLAIVDPPAAAIGSLVSGISIGVWEA